MKNNEQQLSGKEKLKLAEQTMLSTLPALGFNLWHSQEFLMTMRTRQSDTLKLLKEIDGGIDEWGGCGNGPKPVFRAKRMFHETLSTHLSLMLTPDETQATGRGLDVKFIKSKANQNTREVIQLCMLQLIAYDKQIDNRTAEHFRNLLKLWRNTLELGRMELQLAGKPTYTPPIQNVNLFLWILEERVRIWDKNLAKKEKVKVKS